MTVLLLCYLLCISHGACDDFKEKQELETVQIKYEIGEPLVITKD
jgi:hypothetical protein